MVSRVLKVVEGDVVAGGSDPGAEFWEMATTRPIVPGYSSDRLPRFS
jgi:hypothetical protein